MHRNIKLSLGLFVMLQVVWTLGAGQVPKPESVLGFAPGADMKLATYDQVIDYFKALAEASPRLKLMEAGRTTRGRVVYYALVSSPENLAGLDRLREISRLLAHPRGLTDDEARALAGEGKAFVHIDGGCHATEVAGPQMIPQLACDLLARPDDPRVREILENDVVMLWPSMNPDGQQMVGEWFQTNLGTPYESSRLPWLYQEYVGHDNNRDAYMINMIESRLMEHVWLPPFADPVGRVGVIILADDVKGFEAFVRGGGTVVCFNSACRTVIQQFNLPVRNAVEGLRSEEFFLRGSIVEVTVDVTHPVMAGMPEKAAVFVDGSPVFEMLDGFKGRILARYAESGSPLLSGFLIGEKLLFGKAAALDLELDQGHVVLLGFRPEWRAQSFGTFRVLLNAALFGK